MSSIVIGKTYPEKKNTRRQLTLFVQEYKDTFEEIRRKFNPLQYALIPAHVTLCREDEISLREQVIHKIKSFTKGNHLKIKFGKIERFDGNKGLWLPGSTENSDFYEIRSKLLDGLVDNIRRPKPHITLMHPANSTCTDEIFEQINRYQFPTEITFKEISHIEQIKNGKWKTIGQYEI